MIKIANGTVVVDLDIIKVIEAKKHGVAREHIEDTGSMFDGVEGHAGFDIKRNNLLFLSIVGSTPRFGINLKALLKLNV
mgnify:CR=1 FL=1